MIGQAEAHGAITVVNAIAMGKGAALGVDLLTKVEVEIGGDEKMVSIEGLNEDDSLVRMCVERIQRRFGLDEGFNVTTHSQIPPSRGLKSSSAVANATIMATLDAIGARLPYLEVLRMGAEASIDVGVSVTGAIDDASASLLGGVCLTDNAEGRLLARYEIHDDVRIVLVIPDRQIRKSEVRPDIMRMMAWMADMAFASASEGRWEQGMMLNGMVTSLGMGLGMDATRDATALGARAAGVSGTGPATAIVVDRGDEDDMMDAMACHGRTMVTDVWNGDGKWTLE